LKFRYGQPYAPWAARLAGLVGAAFSLLILFLLLLKPAGHFRP
jgi:hypothetical protein